MKGIHTYLTFNGNAAEAMKFYSECLGAELEIMTFAEAPMPAPKGKENEVLHACVKKGENVLMASDCAPGQPYKQGNNFSVSLGTDTLESTEKYFKNLSQGGTVNMPLEKTFWAERFGMVTDKFGIQWIFNYEKK